MKERKHAIVILAAGASSRMGKIKQLLPLEDTTMLKSSIHMAMSSEVGDVYVVLGANRETIISEISEMNIKMIVNEDWEDGLGKSIASGVSNISNENYDGVFIILADQVMIKAEHLIGLSNLQKRGNSDIIKSVYGEKLYGPPAYFGKIYFDELKTLTGDEGARSIFMKYDDQVVTFPCPEGRLDLDTIEDYAEFMAG